MASTSVQALLLMAPVDVKPYLNIDIAEARFDVMLQEWIDEAKYAADCYMNRNLSVIPPTVKRGVVEWVKYEWLKHLKTRETVNGTLIHPPKDDSRPKQGKGQRVKAITRKDGEKVEYYSQSQAQALAELPMGMQPDEIKHTYWCKHRMICGF